MSFSDMLKSLIDIVFSPRRARKGARRVGDPCRMPLIFQKEIKNKWGGVFVLQFQNTGLSQVFFLPQFNLNFLNLFILATNFVWASKVKFSLSVTRFNKMCGRFLLHFIFSYFILSICTYLFQVKMSV